MTNPEWSPIEFTVEAQPVPQPRHRVKLIPRKGTRCNACRRSQMIPALYLPEDHPVNDWRQAVSDAWLLIKPNPGFKFDGPLAVTITFYQPRPSSMVWKTKPMPALLDDRTGGTQSGDLDNLEKGTLDALTGKAWYDDGQICRKATEKWMVEGGGSPHAIIRISPLTYDGRELLGRDPDVLEAEDGRQQTLDLGD